MLQQRIRVSWREHSLLSKVFLLCCMVHAAQAFVNSPKIITKDGNLIIESGLNRNISFQLSGNSRICINDEYDLMDLMQINGKARSGAAPTQADGGEETKVRQLSTDLATLKTFVFGAEGLDQRVRGLQNRTRTANQAMRRYQTRLQRVERKVQTLYERLELDNCKSNPCENGGTCFNIFSGFICKCTKNFEGLKCEKDVNECALFAGTDLGCQNGGQCVNQFGGYSCICGAGWYGIHCTQRKGDCMQSSAWELCGHGTCVSSNDDFGYKCICDQGWKTNGLTPSCMVDVDECSESHPPCSTKCINLPGSFTCSPCAAGLTGNGVNCRDIDECATQNGGCSLSPTVPCINTYGSYHCGECPLGWTGDGRTCVRRSTNDGTGSATSCASNNICHPDAKCSEISNTVVCSCPAGMVGSGVGVNGCVRGTALNCNSMPCMNGGTCVDAGDGYTCLCPVGYRGPTCTPIPSPCTPNPCHNNGRCRPTGGIQFQCQCPPGYTGRLCDNLFSRCGGLLVGAVGHLKYPQGSLYDHNAQCAWVIRTNETQVLNVTFNAFELEDATECRFDWLQINDGRTAAAHIIGRFCGSHKPLGGNLISSTNELYLWFRSDNSTAKEGFDIEWNSIPPQCGGPIEATSHGTIVSPGSPGKYPKNRDCQWTLNAPNNKRIKLTFFSLQIENHDSCNYDYLEITDPIASTTLAKFCNSSNPSPLMLPTSTAVIHFHSDNEGSDTGFQIFYSLEERIPGCGGTFTAKEDTIKSPASLREALSCEYDIKMPVGESIKIIFKKLEMHQDDCIELYDVEPSEQTRTLQSKYCGGSDVAPYIFHSLYNAVHIKYHATGGEFQLKYESDCSYNFQSERDTILSPGFPKLSNTARLCTYKITTEPNTVISVNVADFDVRDSGLDEECTYSFLRINDGMDKNIMGPFCGNSTPPRDFVSQTNMLILHFQTGVTTSGTGFRIEYKAVPMGKSDCGGVYTKPGYSVRLPTGDDGMYLHNMECYWVIMAPQGKGILITWKSFSMEQTMDCMYDYVEIYDNLANSENDKPLGRYCDTPPAFLSHSRLLTVKFVSDSSDARDGFEFTYDFVDLSKQCGGDIYSSTGAITSPEYPVNYTNGVDCTWTISTPAGTQLELQIEMFELQPSADCNSDWLEIRNGGSTSSPLVGKYCGTSVPRVIPSFTNQMRLHLHTDERVSARGFRISWYVFSNGCGGNLNSESGVITSPLYPNPYPHNAECEWRVQVHQGSAIHFTIQDLEIEELFDCNYDFLEIFDGRTANKPLLGKMCRLEQNEHKELVTSGNEALVHFRTDSSQNERGFLLSFYANCTRVLGDLVGVIESPNYGNPFADKAVNCTWTIKAPKGNKITLQFAHFEKLDGGGGGGIYFIEPDRNQSAVHVVATSVNYTTAGSTLIIRQNSSLINFRLEYLMFGCVQVFHRDSGEFQSPNFPDSYPNDMECAWEIRTTLGKGIELTVTNMDIEESVNCTKDALVISSNLHSNDTKERHCGKQETLVMTISSHRMFVKFYSNALNNGKGFSATYRTLKSQCGGVLNSKNGIITSPNYPLNYPPNADCEWTIAVSAHHSITFTMDEIDMENYYSCDMDYVEAYEPKTNDNEEDVQLFKECSLSDSSVVQWTTQSNTATVHFKSDESIQAKGFKLSYKEKCGERIMLDDNSYDFFSIARSGEIDEICEWHLITKDLSKHVDFTVTHMQLNPLVALNYKLEGDCLDVGAKIFDGFDDTAPLRAKFCKTHPPPIISNGHALTIKVPLNVISEFDGYFHTVDNYCGGYYDSINGKFASPYYPTSYPVNMNCEWYISASAGNSIVLTFESVNLEESEECNNDYLEVREDGERGHLLGLFCGSSAPEPIVGANTLWVKFRSDDDNVGQGFLASYNYATHNEINGTNGTIESPKYPTKFHADEPYTWRITVDNEYAVVLTIKHIVDVDMPFIKFYDGYSDIGVEIPYANTHVVRTTTNILYLKATRGPFEFEWQQLSKEVMRANQTAEESSKLCGSKLYTVRPSQLIIKNSPGYPNGYATGLNCSWTMIPSNIATHVVLQFSKIDLEEFGDCFADHVIVSASNDLQTWKELDKLCKLASNSVKYYHGTPYLKLAFVTDMSVNKTGFSSYVSSACGSEMTDRQGFVNITALASGSGFLQTECIWTIRVRQSRRIRITFLDHYLRPENISTTCSSYFVVRNGIAEDSPFLGQGKYCDNTIDDVLETTSNRAYVKFTRGGFSKFRASFRYEEISHECSDVIVLSEAAMESMHTIKTPFYPNIPNPHSECVWRVNAPPHHVIAVDFVGQFDLGLSGETSCDREYVQLNDGATELMPLLGVYCGTTKPSTKYTSSNVLRIKYFTDLPEPHLGFMVNVSLGRCGGSYYGEEGEIHSPDSLVLRGNEREFECVYTIEVEHGSTIKFVIEKMHLPDEEDCAETSHLELQEIDTYDDVENITDSLRVCGDHQDRGYIVETSKLVVRYKIKEPSSAAAYSFRLKYSAIGTRCGETIVAARGTLYTPGYPNGVTNPTHCSWRVRVPKGRRVKVELLDFDTGAPVNATSSFGRVNTFRGRLSFANDFQMQSIIARVSNNPPAELYSTDNTMGIDAFLLSFSRHRGFKLRFSSDEETQVCRHNFDLDSTGARTVQFIRHNNSDIYCSYDLKTGINETLVLHVDKFEKNTTAYMYASLCGYISPLKLELNERQLVPDLLCRNETKPTVRLPFPTTLKLLGNKRNKLVELDLQYMLYQCGGVWPMLQNELNVTQPNMGDYDGALECAWAIWPNPDFDLDNLEDIDYWMDGIQLELKLTTDFKGKCEDQYLLLYNGPNQNSPHLGRYCSQASAENLVVERGIFIEYYSSSYEVQSTFNLTVRQSSGCGGKLTYPYRQILFYDQYKNNVECVWELMTEPGFHLGLSFTGRFFIETSKDCKKDFLRVQQKNQTGDWEDLATICGRDPPKSVNTTTAEMRVIFRSDGDTVGDGFTADFTRNCGGTLYATPDWQQISSPGYPKHYENNLACSYKIMSRDKAKVRVRFLDFEVEEPPIIRCMFDNVTVNVHDEYDSVEETVLCGTNKTYEFRGETIFVILRTDHSFVSKGFLLEYSSNVCGGVVTNSSIIQSPRHYKDDNYPPNTECNWNLTAPEGYKILLKFEQLDYESHVECAYDYVEVFKSLAPVADQRVAKFCGNLTGLIPILSIPSNRGLIHSTSDGSQMSKGFKVAVSFVPNCDQKIFLGPDNTTYQFNTYASGYANNLDCSYVFSTTAGRQLMIELGSFHVEESDHCQNDFLDIRDGAGPFADQIGQFCGHVLPSRLMSSRNGLFVRFVSDSKDTSTGFAATISSTPLMCGEPVLEINGTEKAILSSPVLTDGKYPPNTNCFWKIKAEKIIHVKFDRFDLEEPKKEGECAGDFLKIYNSEDAKMVEQGYGSKMIFNGHLREQADWSNMATEHIYCGSHMPDDYFSTDKELFVKFHTDDTVSKTGFSLTATTVNGCFRNFTGTQGRILLADTTDHCDIYITAPENYTLSLYYDEVIYATYDCEAEYIEVFDAHTNTSLQKVCSYAEPGKSLFSTTNTLRMRIKMGGYYTKYDLTYVASKDGPGCGGNLYNTRGLITSPFYPNNVRNNADCRWNIRVPGNLRVLLTFDVFNMGAKSTCHSDYLQIIEHDESGAEIVKRQFCGEDEPKVYKSDYSFVTLRFHKTQNYDGTGWVAKFQGVYPNYVIPAYMLGDYGA